MMGIVQRALVVGAMIAAVGGGASAQTPSNPPTTAATDGWQIHAYPILVWLPLGINIDVDLPPIEGIGSGGGRDHAAIVDGRFDGAYLAGFTADNGTWRIQGDAIWAGIGGDRPESPVLTVDADIIYAYGNVGYALARDLYVTGGVRRLALKYNVKLGDRPNFERKPGIWDPLVGVAYEHVGRVLGFHANMDGGGFGVGADIDLGGTVRVDLKPLRHFGITAGYSILYFKLTDSADNRDFTVKQTLHGPIAGIGFYF